MTFLPIVEREMRAQARLNFTYHLRVIGALTVVLVWQYYSFSHSGTPIRGGHLFSVLNVALFFSIWALVPMLCADCISRERREGTVGLLFLTELDARGVVLAKGLVHGLRAFALVLAALPVMTIALLFGGVTWNDAALSLMMNFSALCWALAAGLIASSLGKSWLRAQLLAFLLAAAMGVVFFLAVGVNLFFQFGQGYWIRYINTTFLDRAFQAGIMGATDLFGSWGQFYGALPPAGKKMWLLTQGRMAAGSVVGLLLGIEIAAQNLRRFWREEPPSARQLWLEKKFCTPIILVSFFRAWMRRKLEKNPVGWLEQRSWSGRLVVWAWFGVMIAVYSAAISNDDVDRVVGGIHQFLAWALISLIAVTSAASFRRERETGVMELLLVAPISIGEIIGGRLKGIWGQFLPAFLSLLFIWSFLSGIFSGIRLAPGLAEFYCGSFLALPIIGLYFSLRRPNFISALMFTGLFGVAVPFGVGLAMQVCVEWLLGSSYLSLLRGVNPYVLGEGLFGDLMQLILSPIFVTLLQGAIAIMIWRRLYHDMERRNFTFSRSVT